MNLQNRTLMLVVVGVIIAGAQCSLAEGGIEKKSIAREGPQPIAMNESNVGRLVPDLELTPVSGEKFHLSAYKSATATVIAFTSTSCPVTKRYAPTLASLEKQYF